MAVGPAAPERVGYVRERTSRRVMQLSMGRPPEGRVGLKGQMLSRSDVGSSSAMPSSRLMSNLNAPFSP
eukprot:2035539-Rhodomonas_salina.1